MKKHYKAFMAYASEDFKRTLIGSISPEQRGNESQFVEKISKSPASLKSVEKNAEIIAKDLFSDEN
jgi:hypothetical protein